MTDVLHLDELPSDVLIIIFDFCHAFDLVRLSEVCTRFHDILRSDVCWIKKSKRALVTNQSSKRFRERCYTLLPLRNKWHVSQNWKDGRYAKRTYLTQKAKLMPWLQLTANTLWWGAGTQIFGFRRYARFNPVDPIFKIDTHNSDVCRFVVRDWIVLAGFRDGSIRCWDGITNKEIFNAQNTHASDVDAVDLTSDVIITGSRDRTVKIWPTRINDNSSPLAAINLLDRIWSIAADPTGHTFCAGSAGNNNVAPLHIFDVECGGEVNVFRQRWRKGAGILDIIWNDPQTLLTCGYDTCIRKWDIRSGTCVGAWADPTDATVYCLSTDYRYTMVSGTQFNGEAVLWDQRKFKYIQMYQHRCSSPVYSISFDNCYLYGAMDQCLFQLKFSGYGYEEKNYRNLF
ncbi:F-box/WD repeat-containing protein 4 [Neodiprion pinetum]|uniref:F-box/WD repeat-containing protein 4-like n=1 Tax=Neodiprion fabricii TaxID=2872261 RepID=UPI001ED8D9F6|nr:F-box/WD repeat-containing protein 4-like [Neodiprion fabricii]XP_046489121.1 F-box/WD repeat-containing protein 4-like [Neodiprion pinetum]XP_046626206.1 F-box/WD repeat-containing protein 4-like [Neodiprion virginianus]